MAEMLEIMVKRIWKMYSEVPKFMFIMKIGEKNGMFYFARRLRSDKGMLKSTSGFFEVRLISF